MWLLWCNLTKWVGQTSDTVRKKSRDQLIIWNLLMKVKNWSFHLDWLSANQIPFCLFVEKSTNCLWGRFSEAKKLICNHVWRWLWKTVNFFRMTLFLKYVLFYKFDVWNNLIVVDCYIKIDSCDVISLSCVKQGHSQDLERGSVWGDQGACPRKILKSRVSEMPFPAFWGKILHNSEGLKKSYKILKKQHFPGC